MFLDTDVGFDLFEAAWHNAAAGDQPRTWPRVGSGQAARRWRLSRSGPSSRVNFGGGIRFVPPGKWSFHINADAYIYQVKYPTSYHTVAINGSQVIPSSESLTAYRTNGMFVFGISYALFH